jgi:cytochrome c-type biogenesis protein CcmH
MLLWLCFAILTAAVVAALLQPLRRKTRVDPAAADLAVYRDQLAEIEAERDRGLLGDEEARSARVEVARRLIRCAEADSAEHHGRSPSVDGRRTQPVFRIVAGAIPIVSIAIYLAFGAPKLPSHPFAIGQGKPVEQASIEELVARVEARLKEQPQDGRGWDVVAPVYAQLGRYQDAMHAYSEASRILGESPKRLVGFAEASLLASNGVVSEEVRRTSERILELEPGRPEPRLWLALAKEQDGDLKGAAADYGQLLDSAPPDAPWRAAVSDRLRLLNARVGAEPGSSPGEPQSGAGVVPPVAGEPNADDAARVARMTPAEREAFVGTMVEGLAGRLEKDGKDLGGWLKLVRAYKVLGREGEATAALAKARRNFDGDQKSLAELDALAKSLGLGS